jgi:hypothetical protein
VRSARCVEIDHRDVRGVELGEHVEERRADAARAAGHDDAEALIAERLRHALSPRSRLAASTRSWVFGILESLRSGCCR